MRYVVLALLFMFVIGIAGFLALSQKKEPQTPPKASPLSQTASSPTQSPIQKITDSENLIALSLPETWTITKEDPQGVLLSQIHAQSPDFLMRTDNTSDAPFTKTSYEQGASLDVSIQKGERSQTDRPVGDIFEEKQIIIDGVTADYFRYKSPSAEEGEIRDVRFSKDNKSYFFTFVYNPKTLPEAAELFQTIITSVTFTK